MPLSITLTHIPRKGRNKGIPQRLHKFADGKFVVSPTKFEKDYVRVDSEEEATRLILTNNWGGRFGDKRPSHVKEFMR